MWEKVSDCGHLTTYRMKVPDGWLVITASNPLRTAIAVAQTFVADPDYQWELKKSDKE